MTYTCILCLKRGLAREKTRRVKGYSPSGWRYLCLPCHDTLHEAEVRECRKLFIERGY